MLAMIWGNRHSNTQLGDANLNHLEGKQVGDTGLDYKSHSSPAIPGELMHSTGLGTAAHCCTAGGDGEAEKKEGKEGRRKEKSIRRDQLNHLW